MAKQHDEQDQASLKMILWLVYLSLFFSLFIYALVIWVIPAPEEFVPLEIARGNPPKIFIILVLASMALLPILKNLRERMFFGPLGEACYPGSAEARSAYFAMSLTTWIACEVVGVFGFAIHFLTYEPWLATPFVILAAALMGWYRPQMDAAEE